MPCPAGRCSLQWPLQPSAVASACPAPRSAAPHCTACTACSLEGQLLQLLLDAVQAQQARQRGKHLRRRGGRTGQGGGAERRRQEHVQLPRLHQCCKGRLANHAHVERHPNTSLWQPSSQPSREASQADSSRRIAPAASPARCGAAWRAACWPWCACCAAGPPASPQ